MICYDFCLMTNDLKLFNIISHCHCTDTFLRLFDQYGNQVESQDDNDLSDTQCQKECSNMTYTTKPDSGCQTYLLREGCYNDKTCQGTVIVTGFATVVNATEFPTIIPTEMPSEGPTEIPTKAPTEAPTEIPTAIPTEIPTTQIPTEVPTEMPTEMPTEKPSEIPTEMPSSPSVIPTALPTELPTEMPSTESPTFSTVSTCPSFFTTNTASCTQNYATCGIYACANTTLHMGDCGCDSGKRLAK